MVIETIVKELEDVYHIGFDGTGSEKRFEIVLDGSLHDRFRIIGGVKDNIRLFFELEPEKYGANFLRLINQSSSQKRKGFVALWGSISEGDVSVIINDTKVLPEEFIADSREWVNFKIKFTLIPFENDAVATSICTVLCGMMLSLIDYSVEGFEEGAREEVHSNKYERNPINREICLAARGYKCGVCGFDFEERYGIVGRKTIEVHHLTPVSKMGEGYVVKPLEDLLPVCSNCHTIIHKRNPPYTPEEMVAFLAEAHEKKTME